MMLLLFLIKELIKRWCYKYSEKFWFKWKKWVIIIFSSWYNGWITKLLFIKTIEKTIKSSKRILWNNKERLQEQAKNKYRELSHEEKEKKRE